MNANVNRLMWFEWTWGIAGALIFAAIGVLALTQQSIHLPGRTTLAYFEGRNAVLVGCASLFASWYCVRGLLRTTRFRDVWRAVAFLAAVAVGGGAYLWGLS